MKFDVPCFQQKKVLIFDLDGTLIDSVPDLAFAVNDMLGRIGKKRFDEETIRYWVGNGAQMLVKRALVGKREIDDNDMEADFTKALSLFLEAYENTLCKETLLYPGVYQTLERLLERGYKLAIVTNKPTPFVAPILKKLGLDPFFDAFLGGDSLPEKKPHPAPLLHMCSMMGVDVGEALMIGDSKNDILAAKSCNMQSIGVTYGYNYGEDISIYGPDAVIDHFPLIDTLLQ